MEARKVRSPSESFHLSLRIRHPTLDPADISRELRMEPEYCFKAGEERDKRSASKSTSHLESYWLAPLDPAFWENHAPEDLWPYAVDNGTLDMALVRCAYLLRRNASFLRRLQMDGGEASLLVEVSTAGVGGFSLTPQCTGALYELGVGVEFEFAK